MEDLGIMLSLTAPTHSTSSFCYSFASFLVVVSFCYFSVIFGGHKIMILFPVPEHTCYIRLHLTSGQTSALHSWYPCLLHGSLLLLRLSKRSRAHPSSLYSRRHIFLHP